jgi:hypothetical protein
MRIAIAAMICSYGSFSFHREFTISDWPREQRQTVSEDGPGRFRKRLHRAGDAAGTRRDCLEKSFQAAADLAARESSRWGRPPFPVKVLIGKRTLNVSPMLFGERCAKRYACARSVSTRNNTEMALRLQEAKMYVVFVLFRNA